jgi:hypothetical protein
MFWTSWIVAVLAFIPLLTTNGKGFKGWALIKNNDLRVVVEFLTSVVAILGIWFFPLVPVVQAHIVSVIAGICMLYTFLVPIRKRLAGY